MASSLNHCTFIGNLGRDPEVRHFASGDAVCNVTIACTERWKDKTSQETKEKTEWIPLVFIGPLAEVAGKYLHKGSKVHVSGKFTTRKWQDKDGVDRYTTEVRVADLIMLDGRPAGDGEQRAPAQRAAAPAPRPAAGRAAPAPAEAQGGFDDMDDDIPF